MRPFEGDSEWHTFRVIVNRGNFSVITAKILPRMLPAITLTQLLDMTIKYGLPCTGRYNSYFCR